MRGCAPHLCQYNSALSRRDPRRSRVPTEYRQVFLSVFVPRCGDHEFNSPVPKRDGEVSERKGEYVPASPFLSDCALPRSGRNTTSCGARGGAPHLYQYRHCLCAEGSGDTMRYDIHKPVGGHSIFPRFRSSLAYLRADMESAPTPALQRDTGLCPA